MWKQSLLLYEDNYKDTVTCTILWLDNNFYMGCKQYLTLESLHVVDIQCQ